MKRGRTHWIQTHWTLYTLTLDPPNLTEVVEHSDGTAEEGQRKVLKLAIEPGWPWTPDPLKPGPTGP